MPNATTGDGILTQTATMVGAFTPLVLAFTYFFVLLVGATMQKTSGSGRADYPMWAVIASIATFLVALVLSMANGIIQLDWLVVVIVVTIFSGIWLFLSKRGSEV